MKYLTNNFSIVLFFTIHLVLGDFAFAQTSSTSNLEGNYRGEVQTVQGAKVIIEISIIQGPLPPQDDNPSDIWDRRAQLSASVVIDREAGPYTFQYVDFNPLTGDIDLQYFRQSNRGNRADFQIKGRLAGNAIILGEAISGPRGKLGNFSLKQISTRSTALTTRPIYVGTFKGKNFHPALNKYDDIKFELSPSSQLHMNPANYEFDYSPGRIGSFSNTPLQLALQKIFFDYFTKTFNFVHESVESRTITWSGTFSETTLKGESEASLLGRTGIFEVTKVRP